MVGSTWLKQTLATALASLAWVAFTEAGHAQPLRIPLQPYVAGLTTVQLTMNGQTGTFLFDTGEGLSIISPDFASRVHCEPWGQITGFRFSGERLDAPHCDDLAFRSGSSSFAVPVAGVIDIMSLIGANAPHVDGAVGLDIFAGRVISIIPHEAIIVETPESLRQRIAHGRELPVRLVRDAQGAALTVDGGVTTPKGTAWMELDTGNSSGNLMGNHLAALFGLPTDQSSASNAHLTLANGIQADAGFRTGNFIMDGNLGAAFLNNWVLTFDLRQGRAWLSPAGGSH